MHTPPIITVNDILSGKAPKSPKDQLQGVIDTAKSVIMGRVATLLEDGYSEPKDLKDLTSITISIENSVKEGGEEGALEALLAKYSRTDDV